MKIVTFAPIDASNYSPGLGTISAASLLSIDYQSNVYRWQACTPEGELLSTAVFGSSPPAGTSADESRAGTDIRADIARTNTI